VRVHLGLITIPLLILLAACGGGMSKEEVVKEGDKICVRTADEIFKLGNPQTAEEVNAYGSKASKVYGSAVEDFKELDPPNEGKEDFEVFVEALEDRVRVADRLADAQGEQITDLIVEAMASEKKSYEAAEAYGFERCGPPA